MYHISDPIEGAEITMEQLFAANRFKNELVAIERSHLDAVASINDKYPDDPRKVELVKAANAAAAKAYREERDKYRADRNTDRHEQAKIVIQRQCSAMMKKADEMYPSHPDKDAELQFVNTLAHQARNEARRKAAAGSDGVSPLYWTSYNIIWGEDEASRKAKKKKEKKQNEEGEEETVIMGPRFRRWEGTGQLGGQIQQKKRGSDEKRPLSVSDLLSGKDTQVRLLQDEGEWWLWLRVSSGEKKKPIWAIFPITYHRPLPPTASIQEVKVSRYRVGTHRRWQVQFTLKVEREAVALPAPTRGIVTIDVGWRTLKNGDIRVASYYDVEADRHEKLILPRKLVQRWEKTEDLRSIQDLNRNTMLELLQAFRKTPGLPKWFMEATAYAHTWKSPRKLIRLAQQWREQRFNGDGGIFLAVEWWRQQDRHLKDWESFQRENVLLARREIYRLFAVEIAKYREVHVEHLNLRDFAELPGENDPPDSEQTKRARTKRFKSSPSELLGVVADAVVRAGGKWVEKVPDWTTQWCWVCDRKEKFDAAKNLVHTCLQCGRTWDQDENACVNILRAPVWVPGEGKLSRAQRVEKTGVSKRQERWKAGKEEMKRRRSQKPD